MSVLYGTVKKVSSKQWDDGNISYSVLIMDDAGGENWYTNYAYENKGQPAIDSRIMAEIKCPKSGGRDYINDYELEGGQTPQAAPNPPIPNHTKRPAEASSGGNTEQYDREKYKQLSIMCQSAFAAIVNKEGFGAGPGPLAEMAFKAAIFWDKKIRAYMGGLDLDAMKGNLADDVQAAVNEQDSHADNTDVAGPEHTSQPDDPGFDDSDVPF